MFVIKTRSSLFPLHCISGKALRYLVLDTIPKFYINILLKNNLVEYKILKLSPLDPAGFSVQTPKVTFQNNPYQIYKSNHPITFPIKRSKI